MHDIDIIKSEVKKFIGKHSGSFDPGMIEEKTPLFSSGLLDSTCFIKLILFLEQVFQIAFNEHLEVNMENMDTIELIADNIGKCVKSSS